MKLLATLSTLLYALSLSSNALPLPSSSEAAPPPPPPQAPAPPPPTIVETAMYKHVNAAHTGLVTSKRYVFTMETPLGQRPDAEEEFPGLNALQQKFGFEHIYLVVGEVKEKKTGPPKGKQTIERDFQGSAFHMVVLKGGEQKVETRRRNIEEKDLPRKFKHVKDNTGRSDSQISSYGKGWEKDHAVYNLATNNCNTYVDFLKKYV